MSFYSIKKLSLILLALSIVPACERKQVVKRKKITIVRHSVREQSHDAVISPLDSAANLKYP